MEKMTDLLKGKLAIPMTATVTLRFPVSAFDESDAREQVDQRFPTALAITITRDSYPEEIEEHDLCAQVWRPESSIVNRSPGFLMVVLVLLFLALMFAAKSCHAEPITKPFLHAVAMRESGNNPKAIGKAGERGPHQLKAVAVREVNRVTGTKWQHAHVMDPELSELIAYAYLKICQGRSDGTAAGAYRKYRGLR